MLQVNNAMVFYIIRYYIYIIFMSPQFHFSSLVHCQHYYVLKSVVGVIQVLRE